MAVSKSGMRVISGTHRGRLLKTPPQEQGGTRPTMDRVKASLFDILSPRLDQAHVLDLCSGTGALGIEALSRGAAHSTMIEKDVRNVKLIATNLAILGLEHKGTLIRGVLPNILKRLQNQSFDVILFDPPYTSDLAQEVVPNIIEQRLLKRNGQLIIERSKHTQDLSFSHLTMIRQKRMGDTILWFFQHET